MSNKDNNKVITIGMKYSGKEFIIRQSEIEAEQFNQYIDNLMEALRSGEGGVGISLIEGDYLYVSSDSIGYLTIIDN